MRATNTVKCYASTTLILRKGRSVPCKVHPGPLGPPTLAKGRAEEGPRVATDPKVPRKCACEAAHRRPFVQRSISKNVVDQNFSTAKRPQNGDNLLYYLREKPITTTTGGINRQERARDRERGRSPEGPRTSHEEELPHSEWARDRRESDHQRDHAQRGRAESPAIGDGDWQTTVETLRTLVSEE